jgi:hypothetical protein
MTLKINMTITDDRRTYNAALPSSPKSGSVRTAEYVGTDGAEALALLAEFGIEPPKPEPTVTTLDLAQGSVINFTSTFDPKTLDLLLGKATEPEVVTVQDLEAFKALGVGAIVQELDYGPYQWRCDGEDSWRYVGRNGAAIDAPGDTHDAATVFAFSHRKGFTVIKEGEPAKPKVGDELTVAQMLALPEESLVTDCDDDDWTLTDAEAGTYIEVVNPDYDTTASDLHLDYGPIVLKRVGA